VILVAAGGDGTVSTVASAVLDSDAVLGVLPFGTLNHFARDAGIPTALPDAVAAIVGGRVLRVDVGDLNGGIFLNNSSLGLYPRIVAAREEERRRGHRKWIAMAIASARAWRRLRRLVVHLTLDGVERVMETPFVFVGNNQYRASGIDMGGRTSLTEGELSLYVAPECSRFDLLRLILRAVAGRVDRDPHFDGWRVREARIETSRHHARVALDGELQTVAPPLLYRIRPGALPILVPE
jgi:diacylglycerol kinase family enzyme